MLLNIEEPNTPDLKNASQNAIGIDLGTTNSVAAIWHNDKPILLEDNEGKVFIPSIVHSGNTILRSTKRMMHEPTKTIHKEHTAISCAYQILKNIKTRAEKALKKPIHQAVITVPAYFDDTARQATKDAASLAGLEVLRLINEPTAAALAYGLDQGTEGIFVIYDFGGGTFDISILSLKKGVFQVLSTAGDTKLGGDDIDEAIKNYFGWGDVLKARKAKENLSDGVTLELLEKLGEPFIEKTITICKKALKDAKIAIENVDGIVLVGGSTRLESVQKAVTHFFQKAPLTNLDPDCVVAYGAALQAYQLTHKVETLLLDVIPISLGLETMGGLVEKIIPRNSPIPIRMAQDFTTYQDGQTAITIHVIQGEREFVKDCRSLAHFTLSGIPPMLAGAAKIRVTFAVDVDGLLTVSATDLNSNISQKIEVKPTYGLTADDYQKMLFDAYNHAKEDMSERLLHATIIKTKQMIDQLANALNQDKQLLDENEYCRLKKYLENAKDVIKTNDYEQINTACNALIDAAQPFAEKRLSYAIKENVQII